MTQSNQVVPVEPTNEMLVAAMKASPHLTLGRATAKVFEPVYRAMLAAAPQHQGEPVALFSPAMKPDLVWLNGKPKECTKLYIHSPSADASFGQGIEPVADKVLTLLNHIEDVVDDVNWEKIDVQKWNDVTTSLRPLPQPLTDNAEFNAGLAAAATSLREKAKLLRSLIGLPVCPSEIIQNDRAEQWDKAAELIEHLKRPTDMVTMTKAELEARLMGVANAATARGIHSDMSAFETNEAIVSRAMEGK